MCIFVYVSVYICVFVCVYMCMYMCICVYVCIYVCIVYRCVCVCVCETLFLVCHLVVGTGSPSVTHFCLYFFLAFLFLLTFPLIFYSTALLICHPWEERRVFLRNH